MDNKKKDVTFCNSPSSNNDDIKHLRPNGVPDPNSSNQNQVLYYSKSRDQPPPREFGDQRGLKTS